MGDADGTDYILYIKYVMIVYKEAVGSICSDKKIRLHIYIAQQMKGAMEPMGEAGGIYIYMIYVYIILGFIQQSRGKDVLYIRRFGRSPTRFLSFGRSSLLSLRNEAPSSEKS